MKITVLAYVDEEKSIAYDVVVHQIAKILRRQKHKVSVMGIHGDPRLLVSGLQRRKPDLIFNLVEMFGQNLLGDVAVAGTLDLLQIPFTGGGAGELYLGQDKGLAKKILAYDGIKIPNYAVFSKDDDLETGGGNLRMPIFVKPLRADASIGIEENSLVYNMTDLMKRVANIHETIQDSALAEEYIEGREFYVGVLGNQRPMAFPPIEMDFSGLPEGAPHVLGSKAKWATDTPEFQGTHSVVPQLSDELKARLQEVALAAYRALRVCDYGRVDLRLTPTNEIYVIEVNANCYLEEKSELVLAAREAGIDQDQLVARIVDLATERNRRTSPPVAR